MSLLVSYRSDYLRWQKSDDYSPFPLPKDNAAANLLWFFPQPTILLFRHPTTIIRGEGRTDFAGEPDMTISPIKGRPPSPDRDPKKKLPISEYALDQRTFAYGQNVVEISIGKLVDNPNDRYSNGEIVSMVDLVGAQIITQICPYFLDPVKDDVAGSFRLTRLLLAFPGRQELDIKEKDLERQEGRNQSSLYLYNLPKTKEELYSMLNKD
jgi:hypothetical protein